MEHPIPWNGGVLATAGNLVFQGTSHGEFIAFAAGKRRAPLGPRRADRGPGRTGHLPGGRQTVRGSDWPVTARPSRKSIPASLAKWGRRAGDETASWPTRWTARLNCPRCRPCPTRRRPPRTPPTAGDRRPGQAAGTTSIAPAATAMPPSAPASSADLRYLDTATHALWDAIVPGRRASSTRACPALPATWRRAETDAIHAYVIKRAPRPGVYP